MNFSFYLATSNMEETYKSVKSIQNPIIKIQYRWKSEEGCSKRSDQRKDQFFHWSNQQNGLRHQYKEIPRETWKFKA